MLSRPEKGYGWIENYPQKLRKDGFVYITIKEGSRSKRFLVHEQKLQQYYQRVLEPHEIPYHIDGIVSNNDIRNLAIFPFANIPSKRSKSAKGKHSRRKGKRKERQVAKILQEWWGIGEFRPTPSSGGWDASGKFRMKGDIVTTDDEFPFCVEIKNNEAWKFSTSLVSIRSKLHKFWEQNIEEAKECGLTPITIFTRNYHPLFVMMDEKMYTALNADLYGGKIAIMGTYITLLDEFMRIPRESIIRSLIEYKI